MLEMWLRATLAACVPPPSPHFPDAGSWWRDPPSPAAAADSPWDVAGIAAWQKHLEEETALSPLDGGGGELPLVEDPELEAIKAKVREMEKEDEWLQELQAEAKTFILRSDPGLSVHRTAEEKIEVDQRSIYVGNVSETGLDATLGWGFACVEKEVDYGGSAEELEAHFSACGQINRVTILCDKFSGHPKGQVARVSLKGLSRLFCPARRYAYIEFADGASVKAAVRLDESTFRGRAIKVLPKRTNMPGISSTDRGRSQGRFHGRGALARRAGFCGRGQRSRTRGRAHRCVGQPGPDQTAAQEQPCQLLIRLATESRVVEMHSKSITAVMERRDGARGRGRLSPWYTPY
ncbi:Embryonic polyadenylate-binding protein 2-A [Varanus komodoensis]|nr:Embryonic polyadenylate-binding protein 2-A [Varanus komodoensis]